MSLHQIIYTSCMRGINGVNDGQQVFSYDASFEDANNDDVKSLFSYQPPALEAGVIMTEEIALTLPKSYIYRRLDNGKCAIALNTYLGRDYMGSAGRFGNHLSHVIVFDEKDISNYPAEFYGGGSLRDHMEFEEVNNPNKPDFLPEPILERGFSIDIDNIIEFLSIGDNMEIYKNMLYATLAFESERKRVVICDEPENIIKWIAAIQYAIPLKAALNINFATYDFDPSLSASQICGVIPNGTRYNSESQRLHFVFDMYQNNYAEFEKDEEFYEFIDTSMSFSYDSLQDFHKFITDGYNYETADENLYAAYRLYMFMTDGISGLSLNELDSALSFAGKYAKPEENKRILDTLFEQRDYLLRADKEYFICVVKYILSQMNQSAISYTSEIKTMMVDRVLFEFLNDSNTEQEYGSFYDSINAICAENNFSIATELMKPDNSKKLFAVMQNDIETWKISFIVRVVSAFVKEQNISVNDLMIDAPLGQTYYGIVKSVYSRNAQNGFFLVTRIIDEFTWDCKYLVNMALNIEGMLFDVPNGNQEVSSLWKYFGQVMLSHHSSDFATAYSILGSYQRYEQIYMLYYLAMTNVSSIDTAKSLFIEHFNAFVIKDREYAGKYIDSILKLYYSKLSNSDSDVAYEAKSELFETICKYKIKADFADELVKELIKKIPFESPSKQDTKLIQDAFQYVYNELRKPLSSKHLLLVIGMVLEGVKNKSGLYDAFEKLERLTSTSKADMSRVTEKGAENYFEWILPEVCELCVQTSDIETIYNLFEMPSNIASVFFTISAKLYLKYSKDEKDYSVFCEFLRLVFQNSNFQIREDIGKVLCKLNKQKLSDLDEAVKDVFHSDRTALRYWDEIKETAESTNPLFNNLSNLFKKRK